MSWILLGVLCAAFGGLCGYVIACIQTCPKILGDLRIDKSDPDGLYLFLELNVPVNAIEKVSTVTLNVKQANFVSQD